jgi:dTDP-4-amino-4,6-dideoxygalactose transaminase
MKDKVAGEFSLSTSQTGLSFIPSPLSFPRVPLAAPYWNRATYREIFRSILAGSVIDGAELEKLRSLIRETLNVKTAILCGSGSLALELTLRAFSVQGGDEVVVPTFCCSAVVSPILAVGATPVLADIGAELNLTVETVDAVLTRNTRVIIVPHLFGNPTDMAPIVDLARNRNVLVIDDAAQALGATIDGQSAGSFGDAGILSFGQGKVCFGLGGGAIVSQNEVLLSTVLPQDLAPPELALTLRDFLSVLIRHRWRRFTAPLLKLGLHNEDPGAAPSPYPRESMANLKAAAATSLVETLEENIAARRACVDAYQKLLGGDDRLQLIAHRTGSACLSQVVRVVPRGHDRDVASDVIRALGDAGYEIQGSYVPLHLLDSSRGSVWDRLPYAERVWADLIELPCEPSVDLADIERIATVVKKAVGE